MTEISPKTVVVNVNRNVINSNRTRGEAEPVFRIQRGKGGKAQIAEAVAVLDAEGREVARFIYKPDGALLACGARAVLVAHHGAKPVSDPVA